MMKSSHESLSARCACAPTATTTGLSTQEAIEFIAAFYRDDDPVLPHDDLGTTYACCRAVLLCSALSESPDYGSVARVTRLPVQFVRLTLELAASHELWNSSAFEDLRSEVRIDSRDMTRINTSLDTVMESFWLSPFGQETVIVLEALRNGKLLWGLDQPWTCTEYAEEFGALGQVPALCRVV